MTTMPDQILFEALTEKQLQVLRVDAQIRKEVLAELRKLEKVLIAQISGEDSFTQKRLKALLSDVRSSIDEIYSVISGKVIKDLTELGKIEAAGITKTLKGVLVGVELSTVPVDKIIGVIQGGLINGSPAESWWQRQAVKLQQRFSDEVRTGLLLGETNDQIIRRVRGTKAFNYTNGIMNVARNDAEALVRSSVQMASNQARFGVFEENKKLFGSYRHVSTLDARTTTQCIVRDGKRWDTDKKPIGHNIAFQVPPIHWNCRSTLVAEVKGVRLPPDAIRAAAGGAVPASTTFEDFLKSKGKAFADEVLGPGRAELWRKGKITLSQLLDQSGNPLTLKELKGKYGV